MDAPNRFVADGCGRAWTALRPIVRDEVTAQYAERLAAAGFWQGVVLRWEMRREIARRISERAPLHGLY